MAVGITLATAAAAVAGSFSVTTPGGDTTTFTNQNNGLTQGAQQTISDLAAAGGGVAPGGVNFTPDPSSSSGLRATVTLNNGTTISTGSLVVANLLVGYFSG